MHIRVVRFTDVTPERAQALTERLESADGPPEGVPSTGIKFLHDEASGTVVVLQHYASAADMEQGARVLDAMDPERTPGTRASVDLCEVKVELSAPGS